MKFGLTMVVLACLAIPILDLADKFWDERTGDGDAASWLAVLTMLAVFGGMFWLAASAWL